MRTLRTLAIVAIALASAAADDAADALAKALAGIGGKLGAEFRPVPGGFAAALTQGLGTCDRIDLEVHVREGGAVEVVAYPRVRGARLDPARASDRAGLDAKLRAEDARIAPLAWSPDPGPALRAARTLGGVADLEAALLAAPALDKAAADLMGAFPPPLPEDQLTAKLREADAADVAKRGRILAGIAGELPEVVPSATPGHSCFEKVVMNRRGAGLDAFRFRVPGDAGDRRLVWAFAYPPGTAKGWYIVPVSGDEPKFVKFHKGGKYEGSGVPVEHATLLQRSETPLRAGGEYILWFQFKVQTPVEIHAALGCVPFAKSDRDAPGVLEEALGLKPAR